MRAPEWCSSAMTNTTASSPLAAGGRFSRPDTLTLNGRLTVKTEKGRYLGGRAMSELGLSEGEKQGRKEKGNKSRQRSG